MCPWNDVSGSATTHERSAFLLLFCGQRPAMPPVGPERVCLTPSFLSHSPLPSTGCLLPLLNMGQIRETSACLLLRREVLGRGHNHSIVPLRGDGWVEAWQQNIRITHSGKLALAQKVISCNSGGAARNCTPFRVDCQCTRTGKLSYPFALSFRDLIWLGFEVIHSWRITSCFDFKPFWKAL